MRLMCHNWMDSSIGSIVGGDLLVEVQGSRVILMLLEDRDARIITGGLDGEGGEGATLKASWN